MQKYFWFVSNFEHVKFEINGKYSQKNYDNPNYHVSCVIFQTYKNAILMNVHSLGWLLWLCFYIGAPFKVHKFYFCVDGMNHYMGDSKCKHEIHKLVVLNIWHVQKNFNRTQDEVKFLEETCFVFNKQQPIHPWSLFGGESSVSISWLTDVMS
jgi:hypothetical protein